MSATHQVQTIFYTQNNSVFIQRTLQSHNSLGNAGGRSGGMRCLCCCEEVFPAAVHMSSASRSAHHICVKKRMCRQVQTVFLLSGLFLYRNVFKNYDFSNKILHKRNSEIGFKHIIYVVYRLFFLFRMFWEGHNLMT